MAVIQIDKITKDYGHGKGVFDLSFSVEKGEVFGFLGPNGAGKTTTIRQLMGFIRPDSGAVLINGDDCFTEVEKIQSTLGYLPGEIAFMDDMTGIEFIKFVASMNKIKDLTRANRLIERFELDTKGKIKKMSKGMKQKIGIVCAFLKDADTLILDEPTSGLDPLMQNKFIELILEEKQRGKTILMSSHIFEEVERTCDRCAIIKDGKLVAVEEMEKLKKAKRKAFEIKFETEQQAAEFAQEYKGEQAGKAVSVMLAGDINEFLKALCNYKIADITIRTQSLEELFMHYYGDEK